jgi:hypothetical protein
MNREHWAIKYNEFKKRYGLQVTWVDNFPLPIASNINRLLSVVCRLLSIGSVFMVVHRLCVLLVFQKAAISKRL